MFRQAFRFAFKSGRTFVRPQLARTFTQQASRSVGDRVVAGVVGAFAVSTLTVWALSKTASADEKVPFTGTPGTKNERTFIAVKPDGVNRAIIGEIIKRFEDKGYKLVGIKMVHPTEDMAKEHYDDLKNKPFFGGLVKFFSSGPIVAMVWEGRGVIAGGRRLLGATNPDDSTPGSIRGDLCVNVGRNIIHGSDGPESAKDEITLWFKEDEVVDWVPTIDQWVNEK